MTKSHLLLPILITASCGGIVHAGEFSLGAARMLAQNTPPPDIVTFTERGHALRDTEGGDTPPRNAQRLRGADEAPAPATNGHRAIVDPPAKTAPDSAPAATDSAHGASSVSPAAVIRRPSYRWQSLVPGTIK
jgi:hypothetical protein